MASTKIVVKSGTKFLPLLALIFITLKLIPDDHGHIIDWSWWWVLSPLWIISVVTIGGLVVLLVLNLIFGRK
jgi:hypothetical protein